GDIPARPVTPEVLGGTPERPTDAARADFARRQQAQLGLGSREARAARLADIEADAAAPERAAAAEAAEGERRQQADALVEGEHRRNLEIERIKAGAARGRGAEAEGIRTGGKIQISKNELDAAATESGLEADRRIDELKLQGKDVSKEEADDIRHDEHRRKLETIEREAVAAGNVDRALQAQRHRHRMEEKAIRTKVTSFSKTSPAGTRAEHTTEQELPEPTSPGPEEVIGGAGAELPEDLGADAATEK
ncbi:unnamed protein product, partial [marine sediment metagenome]